MSDEKQHWVPKFLIKNFVDTDGRVFSLNIQTDEITKPPPKYAAASPGFNDFRVEGGEVTYEDELGKIETQAAPILKHIVKARSLVGLIDIQRKRIADFLAAQSFRTEAFSKGLDKNLSRDNFGPIFLELWRSAFLLSAEIAGRAWALMVIEHDDVFYLGDHPVVLQYTDKPADQKELGFDIEGVEALMPISPKCALWMPCTVTGRQLISGYEDALNAPALIQREKNVGIEKPLEAANYLALAQKVAVNTKPIYEALTTGVPLIATSANVENLNYLQCAWAHTAVYSNRNDFAFAKMVLNKTPQYRGLVKVRIVALGSAVTSSSP